MNKTVVKTKKGFYIDPMEVGEKIEVVHPKCAEVKGTVERIINENFPDEIYETTTFAGYQDWYSDLNEAKKYLAKDNEEEYNGSAQSQRALDQEIERGERQTFYAG